MTIRCTIRKEQIRDFLAKNPWPDSITIELEPEQISGSASKNSVSVEKPYSPKECEKKWTEVSDVESGIANYETKKSKRYRIRKVETWGGRSVAPQAVSGLNSGDMIELEEIKEET